MPTADFVDVDSLVIVAEHGPFLLHETGAVPNNGRVPTLEEWQAATEWCQQVEKASPFWVGDLLLFGDRFGDLSSQVLQASGYAEQTCSNAKWTCASIPPERRKINVPFSHHSEVAALPPAEQDAWLAKCEEESLTRQELRTQLKVAKGEQTGVAVDLWLMVKCTSIEDQQELATRMQVEGRSIKMHV